MPNKLWFLIFNPFFKILNETFKNLINFFQQDKIEQIIRNKCEVYEIPKEVIDVIFSLCTSGFNK